MTSPLAGRARKRIALAVVGTAVAALSLTACGSADTPAAQPSPSVDLDAALQEKQTLTVWSWSGSIQSVADAFEKKYPAITIDVQNVGTGNDQYTKLQNAIKAGKGAPDLATIEYNALPQFALTGALADLNDYGFGDLAGTFTPSTWDAVNVNGGLYELPLNAGPMALFYNKATFDKYGIAVPTTWSEYLDAARALHAADPNTYIAADTGDAGFTTSMIWAAGGHPFTTTNGTDVTIDLADKGTVKFTDFWNQLIDEGLLAPVSGWSTEWYAGLTNGSIATLATGAWMAGTLKSGVPDAAGAWRVAPLPTFVAGEKSSATNGGGSFALLEQSKHKLAAAAFQKFISVGEGADITQASGSFPARTSVLGSADFLAQKDDYFGGQEINQVFVDSLDAVLPDWQYLPYQVYANSVFNDSVGSAYTDKTGLQKGLDAWQDDLVTYGNDQGFTVTK